MITKGQAYRSWEKWLDECPVDWYGGRPPTSEIETINFDFGKYKDEEYELRTHYQREEVL